MNSGGSVDGGTGGTSADDDRERNNKLNENNIQIIIEIGMPQEDYKPTIIQNLI